jgi:hypothetical protein
MRRHELADQLAENRARDVLLENGWRLRAGAGNPAVIVCESEGRMLYGSRFAEIVGRAIRQEQPRYTRRRSASRNPSTNDNHTQE